MRASVVALLLCVVFVALCSVDAEGSRRSRGRKPAKPIMRTLFKKKPLPSKPMMKKIVGAAVTVAKKVMTNKMLPKMLPKMPRGGARKMSWRRAMMQDDTWGEGLYNRTVGGTVKQTWKESRQGVSRRLMSKSPSANITLSFHAWRSEYTFMKLRIPLNSEGFACLDLMVNLSRADAVKAAQTDEKELPSKNFDLIEKPCKRACGCERNFYLRVADADAPFVPGASVTGLTSQLQLGEFPDAKECNYRNEWQKKRSEARWNKLVSNGYCDRKDEE